MRSPTKGQNASHKSQTRAPVLVLGIGNILLRDDGVGVRVVEAMQTIELPGGVELHDGGTAGVDLIDEVSERSKVIVIDAAQSDEPPGTIFRLTPADFAAQFAPTMSLHQVGLLETLQMTKLLGCAPGEVTVFAVTSKDLAWGDELSDEVAAAIPQAVELVQAEVDAWAQSAPVAATQATSDQA